MATADIAQLGQLNAFEPLDLDNYADNKEYTPIPAKGRYTVQAPDGFSEEALSGRTKAGTLQPQIDPTIVGPTGEGYKLWFTKVSSKTFKRSGLPASQVGDYLRAVGLRGITLRSEDDIKEAIQQTANRTYEVEVDWRAYSKATGASPAFSVEGMERFPSNGDGGYLPWFNHPTEKDEAGEPIRLKAQLVITRYIPSQN